MTLYNLAQRFVGLREKEGPASNGFITWAHELCGIKDAHDEVPWCSSWLNALCWMLRLPRSKSASARSWLEVGMPVPLDAAVLGDVVIFKRGKEPQPGPEVTRGAIGHVALYAGRDGDYVLALGGNQGNQVCVARYPVASVLGVRRL